MDSEQRTERNENPLGCTTIRCGGGWKSHSIKLAARIRDLEAEVERLRAERQAVLDCINLYGDETLHDALDAIGWVPRA